LASVALHSIPLISCGQRIADAVMRKFGVRLASIWSYKALRMEWLMTVSSNPVGTLSLVSQNLRLVLQRQTNIVKTRHQAVPLKIIYGK